MKINYRKWNIIHTEPGIFQGFTFRYIKISIIVFCKFFSINIPYKFISYNKNQAEKLHRMILELETKNEKE